MKSQRKDVTSTRGKGTRKGRLSRSDPQVTVVLHSFTGGFLSGGTTGGEAGSYVTLNFLAGYADWVSTWDQYRFRKITWTLIPNANLQSLKASTAADAYVPPLFTVIDRDDGAAPSSYSNLLEYSQLKVTRGTEIISRSISDPQASPAAYNGSFGGYAQSEPGQWFDCASPAVQFYGFKCATYPDGASQTVHQGYDLHIEVLVEFRFTH